MYCDIFTFLRDVMPRVGTICVQLAVTVHAFTRSRLTRNRVTTFLVARIGDYINDSCQNLESAVCVIFQKGPIVMNLAVMAKFFSRQVSFF